MCKSAKQKSPINKSRIRSLATEVPIFKSRYASPDTKVPKHKSRHASPDTKVPIVKSRNGSPMKWKFYETEVLWNGSPMKWKSCEIEVQWNTNILTVCSCDTSPNKWKCSSSGYDPFFEIWLYHWSLTHISFSYWSIKFNCNLNLILMSLICYID